METVSLNILGREYRVSCANDESAKLRESAEYLNGIIDEIKESGKIVGTDRVAVMAALNLAHDLLKLRDKDRTEVMVDKMHSLQNRIEVALDQKPPSLL